jgi:adenine-specific DNA-methyltransferase
LRDAGRQRLEHVFRERRPQVQNQSLAAGADAGGFAAPARSADLDRFLEHVDFCRLDASRRLDPDKRKRLGQFLTPMAVARLMASTLGPQAGAVRLLDPGAGIGSLSAAMVVELLNRGKTTSIHVTAYEIEELLVPQLNDTLLRCQTLARSHGVSLTFDIKATDFIAAGITLLSPGLFGRITTEPFTAAILNPPYGKIGSESRERALLHNVGIETGNLYTGFLALASLLLDDNGELVAITPRSFCNGSYFKAFRTEFLTRMRVHRLHVFKARDQVFKEDDVLQENLILAARRTRKTPTEVLISSSDSADQDAMMIRHAPYAEVVRPGDSESFIRLTTDDLEQEVARGLEALPSTLSSLGIRVSTGRVVDFRSRAALRTEASRETVPLIYPGNFVHGIVRWPTKRVKKPNALIRSARTEDLLVPRGVYVLVRRFSSKEEPRRVVAAVCDPRRVPGSAFAFENHVNFFHDGGRGLEPRLAYGLAVFLNSTLVDSFFRQFSGHTQVNANDLRTLRYPDKEALRRLGARVVDSFPSQHDLDQLFQEECFPMAQEKTTNPVRAKRRIDEALQILKDFGLPREQQNERSALTLLALLDLRPDDKWVDAKSPSRGITEMMDFFTAAYGKRYAPNTRETVRRFTVHQFAQAGIVIQNPDSPTRPTNSPKNVYQVREIVLDVLRSFGTASWQKKVKEYLTGVGGLQERYAKERVMKRIPVRVAGGKNVMLSPGGQNVLVEKIVGDFCERFTPGAIVIYVGDTEDKWAHFDKEGLAALGVTVEEHGKMPDVVVYHREKEWLVLIEAVTSHGPVNPKRRQELQTLFAKSQVGIVYVTAFLDRRTLMKYLGDIAWETEVWVAESPSHLIHFNGERFLGPYESETNR